MDYIKEYRKHHPILVRIASLLEKDLKNNLENEPRVDTIRVRAKSIERFIEKSKRIDDDSKKLKYNDPINEILDQVGARIVVFYKNDVERVANEMPRWYREIENRVIVDTDPERFGYEGRHFICFIPPEIYNEFRNKLSLDFFELQISTLFQHAWAEANHNLGYKPLKELSYEERRLIAWTAAQAWGADDVFNRLWEEMGESNN